MILGFSATIQSKTSTRNDEGIDVDTWATLKTVSCNVQPARLDQTELQAFGLTDIAANAKKVYLLRDTSINENHRAVLWDGTYEIRGINHWNIHTVFIAVPVQGV